MHKAELIPFTLVGNVVQEGFLFVKIFHQAGKVKVHGVALLFNHALHAHRTDAQQQQHQRAEHNQAFIAAQGAAGQFLQQGIGMVHYTALRAVG